jgi:NADPH:quinone reductase-like Zn-dependent oxidoreductase
MKAAVVDVLGEPPRYQDFAEPTPSEGEVLIHVEAAGLHPVVKAIANGSHYSSRGEVPVVPGIDGVGTLDDGRRVYFLFARKPWGSMCERTVAPRTKCLPLPRWHRRCTGRCDCQSWHVGLALGKGARQPSERRNGSDSGCDWRGWATRNLGGAVPGREARNCCRTQPRRP